MFWTLLVVLPVVYLLLDWLLRSLKVGNYTNRHVFISGCDSGFGKQLAMRLDSLGFNVFAGCLTEDGQNFLKENASLRMTTFRFDVTSSDSVSNALSFVKEKLGPQKGLWAVVNNAGIIGPICPIEMCSKDGFARTMDVNCFGHIEVCQKFLPLVTFSKGRIVNITSMYGRMANNPVAYSVSKFAFEAFSDCLRRELCEQGVKVCILEPGFFKTEIINRQKVEENVRSQYMKADAAIKERIGDAFLKTVLNTIDAVDRIASPDTWKVVDAYTHAVTARFPRTRYVVGHDAKFFMIPLTYFPAVVADWILGIFLRHTEKPQKRKTL